MSSSTTSSIKSDPSLIKGYTARSLISFWVIGLCNNFAYVVMLSAAQDVLSNNEGQTVSVLNANTTKEAHTCVEEIVVRDCKPMSAGLVLICNIAPSFLIKMTAPFFVHNFPYGVRHTATVVSQAIALLITAFANSVGMALGGVMLASLSSGFGEITYLALASHYSPNTISTWSSGTGAAGIAGALSYAGLTDPQLAGLSCKEALLLMMIVPVIFSFMYYVVLIRAPTVKKSSVYKPSTWIEQRSKIAVEKSQAVAVTDASGGATIQKAASIITEETDSLEYNHGHHTSAKQKMYTILKLLKYMVPLFTVYLAQYFINQGLDELLIFDCASGFSTTPEAQYRWYQVLYQIGVFVSRSSVNLIPLPYIAIASLPFLQLTLAGFLTVNTLSPFIPHIIVLFGIIFIEGYIGGSSYANTMHHIHKHVAPPLREFSLLVVSLSSTFGILIAAIITIPIHNYICTLPYMNWFS